MTPYELQRRGDAGYMRFYSKSAPWLKLLCHVPFHQAPLFHGWGMIIIRSWRKDERNKTFIGPQTLALATA